jgi:polar amino acid transport system substrate-binding protein
VYDRALMQYRNLQLGKKRLTLLPDIFQQQLYGFALPAGSEIRGPVSERVLAVTETASWEDTIRRYLGGK